MTDLLKGALLWVENVVGDALFFVIDKWWDWADRNSANNAWNWDEDSEAL